MSRYDYMLIWGNGLQYKDKIIKLIEAEKSFEILKFYRYKPKYLKDFIENVYAYDYAPIEHLREKIKYLYTTKNEVFLIFIRNNEPDEDYFGEGSFRHIESRKLKAFKENIRNLYNERKADRRTENHVIHASDNEMQTDYMLKYLGFSQGTDIFKKHQIFSIPYHITPSNNIKCHYVNIDDLYANILTGSDINVIAVPTKLVDTPHYKTLKNHTNDYQTYLDAYQGNYMQDYYSYDKFINLYKHFDYQKNNNYIIVKNINGKLMILDGVHRAVSFKVKNEETKEGKLCVVEIM